MQVKNFKCAYMNEIATSQMLTVKIDGLVPLSMEPDSPSIFTTEKVQLFYSITVKSS